MSNLPWTWKQFMAAMRKSGYKSMGQGCYVHKQTNRKFYCWNYSEDHGEAWKQWAEVRQVPPPF